MTDHVEGPAPPRTPGSSTTPTGHVRVRRRRDEEPTRRRCGCGWARRSSATSCAASRTCTRCSSSTATGCRSATPTSRRRPRRERSRPGAASPDNPVGGWYGLRKGYRGRFGKYVPPVLEQLGLAEVEHNPRNNRMRAL